MRKGFRSVTSVTALLIFSASAFCAASFAQNPSSPAPSGFPLGPPAKILSFTAEPDSIQPGQSVELTWVVINADRIEVEPGIGVVATRASRSVTPATSTVYALKAIGRGGADRRTLTVTVVGTAPPYEPVDTEADPLANKPIPRTADGHPDLTGVYIGGFDIRRSRWPKIKGKPSRTTILRITADFLKGTRVRSCFGERQVICCRPPKTCFATLTS